MPKKKITVTCIYQENHDIRSIIKQVFLSYLNRVISCSQK